MRSQRYKLDISKGHFRINASMTDEQLNKSVHQPLVKQKSIFDESDFVEKKSQLKKMDKKGATLRKIKTKKRHSLKDPFDGIGSSLEEG